MRLFVAVLAKKVVAGGLLFVGKGQRRELFVSLARIDSEHLFVVKIHQSLLPQSFDDRRRSSGKVADVLDRHRARHQNQLKDLALSVGELFGKILRPHNGSNHFCDRVAYPAKRLVGFVKQTLRDHAFQKLVGFQPEIVKQLFAPDRLAP